ncbi:MAG: PIN domain-containing protein [Methylococcaceae bacterium]
MTEIIIYLDTCSLQRPLDDRSQPRIYLEAEAVLTLLRLVEAEKLKLLSSDVLQFEISNIADLNRKSEAQLMLKLAWRTASIQLNTRQLAEQIIATGIKPFDALHAAVAIENQVHYFCTCDDKLLKKLKTLNFNQQTNIISP